ncbi:MAG: GMC family oxidoreductase [Mobilicoccus sp.]|nr:GMC family oxidoreductase [Mobilicoccus sp.]
MQVHPEVDVVAVGTGFAASIIAQQLTGEGLTVVSLERGRAQWTWPDFAHNHDYLRYSHRNQLLQDLARETWTWRPAADKPSLPFREHGSKTVGQGLGGTSMHWAAGSWRFLPMDFRYRSHHVERYGEDKLPEGNLIQDWPLTYDELEPYYDRFEYDLGISGVAGNIAGQLTGHGSPFEGPRSRPYPMPPLEGMAHGKLFSQACSSLGYHPYKTASSILSQGYNDLTGSPRAGCLYCGYCSMFGCEVDAKGSPLTTYLPAAFETGKYEVRTHSTVVGIEMNDQGHATGLRYIDRHGQEHLQPAARVMLTGFTYTNVRLLLLSRNSAHPDGVGNNRGLVGRNYTDQLVANPVSAVFPGRKFNLFMGNTDTRYAIQDFYGDVFDHSDLDFIGGAHLRAGMGEVEPIGTLDEIYFGTGEAGADDEDENGDNGDEPRQWGQAFKDAMFEAYNSTVPLGMHGEDMPDEGKFLDLDPTYKDAYGQPLLRITFDWTDNSKKMYAYLTDRLEEIAEAMGAERVHADRELEPFGISAGAIHPTGGAIMGTDPGNSVTNRYGQVWDAPNVFVVGAALFPQNPGSNPTETVCAMAYWIADAIKRTKNSPTDLIT